ncbi:uncharacterized protein BO97DRAFT_148240 [Aspergillus homomorphus CBS 101889]|uniref:Uncharacterized protein n=1 Tax=Aspergillus homomorphus (strain CBS 101889) TaxID=1450537 RepID=A0A395HQ65_ASPHC|nr:hypothetical protein BO97DRAFT_148240 [Aspergillus homomorphus CBS 101889]RAL10092.1 hypothetical protein BO97DRAFT_148240 [Aspergillus homomorphus CBS 101889]
MASFHHGHGSTFLHTYQPSAISTVNSRESRHRRGFKLWSHPVVRAYSSSRRLLSHYFFTPSRARSCAPYTLTRPGSHGVPATCILSSLLMLFRASPGLFRPLAGRPGLMQPLSSEVLFDSFHSCFVVRGWTPEIT